MKILVRVPNWLGDAVFSLALVKELRKKHEVSILVKSHLKDLFYEFETYTFSSYSDLFKKSLKLRGYDGFLTIPISFSSALSGYLTGTPRRVGFCFDSRDFLLTHRIKIPSDWKFKHTMWTYIKLLEPFDIYLNEIPYPKFIPSPEDVEKAEELLRIYQVNNYISVAPFTAFGTAKEWGVENFEKLALLFQEKGIQMVILGSKKEHGRAERIKDKNVINLCGKTTLGMAAHISKKSLAFVGNDSGLTHLAAAAGAKTIAIFGPTSPTWTAPLGSSVTVLYKPPPCSPCEKRTCPLKNKICMNAINPEEILEKIK